MIYYPFSKRRELLVFCCTHILDREEDIAVVNHHFDDNNWVFLCAREHSDTDAVITSVGELLDIDSSLELLSDLPVGMRALRESVAGEWKTACIPGESHYEAHDDCCGHHHHD